MTEQEQQLMDRENQWNQAILQADPTLRAQTLQDILAEDYTNTDAEGRVWTKQNELANFGSGSYRVRFLEPTEAMNVRVYGNNFAVVTGADELRADYRSADASGKYRWTDTWFRTDASSPWRCVASHSSRIP